MLVLILLYIVVMLLFVGAILSDLRKNGWSIFSYFSIFLTIFYLVIPIVSSILFGLKPRADSFFLAYKLPNHNLIYNLYLTAAVIFLGLLCFVIGYQVKPKFKIERITSKKIGNISLPHFFVIALSFISLVSFYIYISGFGSLQNAIINANFVRSGYYIELEGGTSTMHTFFFRFVFLCLIPILFFFYNKHKKKSIYTYGAFILCVVLISILYIFLSPGRQSIIDLIMIFVLASLMRKNIVINKFLIIFVVIALIALPILEAFFKFKSLDLNDVNLDLAGIFINEFSFPYYSLIYAMQQDYSFFYFSDFIANIFGKLLPSSFNPGIEATNYLNSYYMLGLRVKSVPPGIFGQGYYSFGVIGVLIISFLTGLLFKYLDTFLRQISRINNGFFIFFAYFITSSLDWVRTGLPGNYFYDILFLSTLLFLFLSFNFQRTKVL